MLGRTLVRSEENECFYFVPVGTAPQKTEKVRRMSRAYFVNRKILSAKWSQSLLHFMEKHHPVLVKAYGEPVLDRPSRSLLAP